MRKTHHILLVKVIVCVFVMASSITAWSQSGITSSTLPIFVIETNGQEIPDEPRIPAHMGIIYNEEGGVNKLTDPFNHYDGNISIEIRGSSSQSFPKKQYRFETHDENHEDWNVPLLGLPEEDDWILYAPYSDKSLIRNILAYQLSAELGHYAPRTRLCELILNGEYAGVYVLIEKIKRDKKRVNISKLKPDEVSGDDLTGGYILKIDRHDEGDCPGWSTPEGNIFLQYEYPKCRNIAEEQKAYIREFMNNFDALLMGDDFADPTEGYRKQINLQSFLDYLIVNEVSKNIDAYRLSTFLYKEKDSKGGRLSFGPVWDYNLGFGNAYYLDGYTTSGLIAHNNVWWSRMLEDTVFSSALRERWCEVREKSLSNERITSIIDSLTAVLEQPQQRNFERWPVLGKKIWPNYYVPPDYEGEINFLKSWITKRLQWLDTHLPGRCSENPPVPDIDVSVFPNPYSHSFSYVFELEKEARISLHLFDSQGRFIADIIRNERYQSGRHIHTWNSFTKESSLPQGLYFLMLIVDGNRVQADKVVKM